MPVDVHDLAVVAGLNLSPETRKPSPLDDVPFRAVLVLAGKRVVDTTEVTAGLSAFLSGAALGASAEENLFGPVVLPLAPDLIQDGLLM